MNRSSTEHKAQSTSTYLWITVVGPGGPPPPPCLSLRHPDAAEQKNLQPAPGG